MAYNDRTDSRSNAQSFEKAIGFLNLSLPYVKKDGTMALYHFPTGIPLRASKPEEKEFAEYLAEDPAHAEMVMGAMKARFVAVQPEGVARGKLLLPRKAAVPQNA